MLSTLFSGPATSSQTSPAQDTSAVTEMTVQIVIAGGTSIVGTFHVEGSVDVPPSGASLGTGWVPTNWTNLSGNIAISGNGTYPLSALAGFLPWSRVVYTFTSGTGGTVTCTYFTQDGSNLSGGPS